MKRIFKNYMLLLTTGCWLLAAAVMITGCSQKPQAARGSPEQHATAQAKEETGFLEAKEENVAEAAVQTQEEPHEAPEPASQNAEEPKGTPADDLVYLKVASAAASSFDSTPDWAPKPDPMAPVDGDMSTRWSPELGEADQWIAFDLGKQKTISRVIIRWESAYATRYEILGSNDGQAWERIALKEDGKGGTETLEFSPVTYRHVKIIGLERFDADWGFSFWEFEMYGPKDRNPDDMSIEETFAARKAAEEAVYEAIEIPEGVVIPSPGPIAQEEFQRGITYTSWSKDEVAGAMSDSSLSYIAGIGTGHISLMVVWYQENVDSQSVFPDQAKTISDEALVHAINVIHKLGMKVMLKPHIDLMDGEMRTYIIPNAAWFESYKNFMLHYAKISREQQVELLCVGTELSNTTIQPYRQQWLDLIAAVREIYAGPIIYAANWDEYTSVSFWDAVDYIGMDAYFPLTEKKDVTKDELIAGWTTIADGIEKWLNGKGPADKKVVFTEVGYDSVDGSNTQPWRVLATLAGQVEDQEEQTDCLDSMLEVLSVRPWFRGFYWWNYFPRPDIGVLGYTLRGKQGEKVLSAWFEKLK